MLRATSRPGEEAAISPLEKIAMKTKPNAPGSRSRNGMTDAWNAEPNRIGSSQGPTNAATTMLTPVTRITPRAT